MGRGVGSLVLLVAAALCAASATVHAQDARPSQSPSRSLSEALVDLQRRGLKIIFSSHVVRPDMRVRVEPRLTSLRRILDELLFPHGLIARHGPGGTVLVVKNPRARLHDRSSREPPPRSATGGGVDGVDPPRFEEAVEVSDIAPHGARNGPAPLSVRPVEIRSFAGGFDDVYRTLQALPGVTGTDEIGSRIAVRGGGPDQNLTVMDGVEIHNPYRLVIPIEDLAMVGLASVFNPDTIERIELVPGAFDVGYGDRLSSLLVVTSREGSEAEPFQGSASLSLVEASTIVEGKLPGQLAGSWLVSSRRSHIDLVGRPLVDTGLPSFVDVHARVSWRPRPQQRLSIAGVTSRERTRLGDGRESDAGHASRTRQDLLAVTFESSLGTHGSSRTTASLSRLIDDLSAFEDSLDNSRGANRLESIASGSPLTFAFTRGIAVRDVAVKHTVGLRPWSRHAIDLGLDAHLLDTRWAWTIAGDRSQVQANGSSMRLGVGLPDVLDSARASGRVGLWVQDLWRLSSRVALQPGVRVDRSSLTGATTVSPRVSATATFGPSWRVDGGLRVHTQTPGYEKMLLADYFVDLTSAAASHLVAERAVHAVAGLRRELGGGFEARVDAYYKRFDNLIVGRLETDGERLARLAGYDVPPELSTSVMREAQITTVPVNAATGRAYGLEVRISREGRRAVEPLSGWVAYSLGRADRSAYGVTRPFDYDRRHALSLAANLRLGARLDISATGRWATGLPRTPVRGVRLTLAPDAGDVDGDGNRAERIPQRDALGLPIFQPDLGDVSDINSARLPAFARVDARVTYRPSWSGERWAFYVDVLNVLNARNTVQIDPVLAVDEGSDRPRIIERAQDRGLPIFPSFGVRFWF